MNTYRHFIIFCTFYVHCNQQAPYFDSQTWHGTAMLNIFALFRQLPILKADLFYLAFFRSFPWSISTNEICGPLDNFFVKHNSIVVQYTAALLLSYIFSFVQHLCLPIEFFKLSNFVRREFESSQVKSVYESCWCFFALASFIWFLKSQWKMVLNFITLLLSSFVISFFLCCFCSQIFHHFYFFSIFFLFLYFSWRFGFSFPLALHWPTFSQTHLVTNKLFTIQHQLHGHLLFKGPPS